MFTYSITSTLFIDFLITLFRVSGIQKYFLRKDRVRELKKQLGPEFGPLGGGLGKQVEAWKLEGGEVILAERKPILILRERPIPVLPAVDRLNLPRVVVDMGAVGPVCRGADVMAPGIVEVDEGINPGDLVVVVDERNRKPLAVGEALLPGGEMKGRSGQAVKNLHHVGDEFWRALKALIEKVKYEEEK